MKILITGSEGYIGSVLLPFLLDAGHQVIGFDTGFFSHRRFLGELPRYSLIKGDIRDVEVSLLQGFDAICHLAALSNDPSGEFNPKMTEDINYGGTISLAEKAQAAGVKRFIFSSSCSIYGAGDISEYLTEEAGFNPVTVYGRSKVMAEKYLGQLANDNFSPVYLRNATVFGLSPKLRLDLVVNNLVAWAFTTGKIEMTSDGTPWRPLVHVKDVCLAFKCALEAPKSVIHNQAFNIGRTDANYQINDIADAIKKIMPDCRIIRGKIEGKDPDKRTYKVSFEKAKKHLPGFVPQWSLKDGIKEIIKGYSEFPLREKHLYGDEFITLNRYKKLFEENKIDQDFRWR